MRLLVLVIVLFCSCGGKAAIPNFHYVDDGIYRSGLLDNTNLDDLKLYNIRSIITMKTNPIEVKVERDYAIKNGIAFVNIPIFMLEYSRYQKDNFWQVNELMHTMPKPLLVHCTHGSDRTGVAIAMYRLLDQKWDYTPTIIELNNYGFSWLFTSWKTFLKEIYDGFNDNRRH